MNSRGEMNAFGKLSERPKSVRVFRHLFHADPDMVTDEIDMFPRIQRGQICTPKHAEKWASIRDACLYPNFPGIKTLSTKYPGNTPGRRWSA